MPRPSPAPPVTLLKEGIPDWNAIQFDVHCARCLYNLRTLTLPRCPECGLDFNWPIVLERAALHGEALFEQSWPKKPLFRWVTTVALAFFPGRLWAKSSIHDPIRPVPLWLLIGSSLLIFILTLHGLAWLASRFIPWIAGIGVSRYATGWATVAYQYERIATWPLMGDWRYLHVPIGWMLAVVGSAALLLSIHQTWNRYRLRPAQALRVIAHVCPPLAVYASVIALILVALVPLRFFSGPLPFFPHEQWRQPASPASNGDFGLTQALLLLGGQGVFLLLCIYYLGAGLSQYLHLARPWFHAAMTVIISVLFAYALLAFFGLVLTGNWY